MIVYIQVLRVAAMWLALLAVHTGLGLVVRRLFGHRRLEARDLLILPWLGWGFAIVVLQFWHTARPVDGTAVAAISVAGALGLAWHLRPLAAVLRAAPRRDLFFWIGVSAVAALWVANHAVRQPGVYDSGLYHLNAIRWAREYPIIPGLGNLHGRLAYNNASFLHAAMLDGGLFRHRAHHLASGFLMLLMLLRVAAAWRELLAVRIVERAQPLFYALFTAPLVAWIANSSYASSPSPDVPCFLLAALLGGELLGMAERDDVDDDGGLEPYAGLCFLAMVGITVKLSFAAYGVTAGLVAFGLHARRARHRHQSLAALVMACALAVLVLVPWCIRGILLSGYAAYPVEITRFDVDWAVSSTSARIMMERITSWARVPNVPPDSVLNTWSWLGPWFGRVLRDNRYDFTAPILTFMVGMALLLVPRRGAPSRFDRRWLCLVPAVAGIVVWFISAPDPRFQGAMLWVLGAGALSLSLRGRRARYAAAVIIAHGLLLVLLVMNPVDLLRSWKDAGPAKRVPMKSMVTDSGLTVYVPVDGDQSWDSELPATPYFSRRLRLRVAGDTSQGFTKSAPARNEADETPMGERP